MTKRLFVIGNGFDLAHEELKTQWSDFKEFLEKTNSIKFLNAIENVMGEYFSKEDLWGNIEEALGSLIYDDEVIHSFSELNMDFGADNWTDSNWEDQKYAVIEKLSWINELPKQIKLWINDVNNVSFSPLKNNLFNKDDLFLNFNYTNTLEREYKISQEQNRQIHGDTESDIIIGHNLKPSEVYQDEYSDIRDIMADQEMYNFKNFIYKNVKQIIAKNSDFFNKLSEIDEIYVLGHSISDIDKEYFKEIKESVAKNSKWFISYHSDTDFNNIPQQCQNLGIKIQVFKKIPEIINML